MEEDTSRCMCTIAQDTHTKEKKGANRGDRAMGGNKDISKHAIKKNKKTVTSDGREEE